MNTSTAERNPNRDEALRLIEAARALRAQYVHTLGRRVWIRIVGGVAALREAQERRTAYRALRGLDQHTLADIGLDRFTGEFGPHRPANENQPRQVA
ncbi:MAG: DUF1127 domain-containing protein [Proteobacteria bacterium]|nr:DUF1127 domain-containing protein [Pseudomonadota bacterium]MDA1057640.1 DUF1127 domain-containing protein [Pseudomonadota bacterium]